MINSVKPLLCAFVGHKHPMTVLCTYFPVNCRESAQTTTSRPIGSLPRLSLIHQKVRCTRCGAVSLKTTTRRS